MASAEKKDNRIHLCNVKFNLIYSLKQKKKPPKTKLWKLLENMNILIALHVNLYNIKSTANLVNLCT